MSTYCTKDNASIFHTEHFFSFGSLDLKYDFGQTNGGLAKQLWSSNKQINFTIVVKDPPLVLVNMIGTCKKKDFVWVEGFL